jgi:hypothetical protein
MLKRKGLPATGNKKDLIKQLKLSDAGTTEKGNKTLKEDPRYGELLSSSRASSYAC